MKRYYADYARKDDPDRRFLQSREWRERIRPRQLDRQPLCEHCLLIGRVEPAEHVDHKTRPRGDYDLQRSFENFQSLCKYHHGRKSTWERRADGLPLVIGSTVEGYNVELPRGYVEPGGEHHDAGPDVAQPKGQARKASSGAKRQSSAKKLTGGEGNKIPAATAQPMRLSSRELVEPTGGSSQKFSASTEQPTRAENSREFTLKSRAEGR